MRKKSFNKGFTLIELLIVVAIIAILAAIAVPNFLDAQLRAKVAAAMTDMRALVTALEAYAVDNNVYPCDGQEDGCEWIWNTSMFRLTSPIEYISEIPEDPLIGNEIYYYGAAYYWYATLAGYGNGEGNFSNHPRNSQFGRRNVRLFDTPRDKFKYAIISMGPDIYFE